MSQAKRLVVKIGTNVLSEDSGQLDHDRISHLASQICGLRAAGYAVAVVSSGAISAGMGVLGLGARPRTTAKLQATAAIGQSRLMALYGQCFEAQGYHAAQVLLTREDFQDFRRYLNIRQTFSALNRLGAIPVINENDTTAVEEITFGDNDQLATMVTSAFEADMLVILSTIDGLYDAAGCVVEVVERVTDDIRQLSFGTVSSRGAGGMDSKLQAIALATDFGDPVVLANGKTNNILTRVMSGEELGTLFLPTPKRVQSRKRWFQFGGKTKGEIWIDAGAAQAISKRGRSLLPKGVVKVAGAFQPGDIVALLDPTGNLVAKGAVAFSSEEAAKLCGAHSGRIRAILGHDAPSEVVHRDHMAIF